MSRKPPIKAEPPKAVGRPTLYQEAFNDIAEDTLGKGYSLAVLAGECGVCLDTVIEWQKIHPLFSESIKRGRGKGARVWEDILLNNAREGGGNATAAIFGLKNRIPSEWRDKTEQEHTGPDGGPIKIEKIERVIVDPKHSDT